MFIRPLSWGVMFLFAYGSLMLAQDNGEADSIVGVVVGLPAGAADIIVCLCDADTGSPVSKKDYKPIWNGTDNSKDLSHVALAISDPRGQFRFDNVPKGKFRLIAQKWTGPFKGIFAEHGTAVQLMGVAKCPFGKAA